MTNTKLLSDPEGSSVRLIGQDYFDLGRKITIPLRQQNVAKVLSPSGGYDANGGGQIDGSLPKGDLNRGYIGCPPVGIEGLGGDINSHHPNIRQKSRP